VGQTPYIQELAPGEHTVKLTKEGFTPFEKKLVMPRERDIELTLALVPKPGPSRVSFDSDPTGAELTIDGKKVGKTPYEGELKPGDHSVSARASGRRRVEEKFTIAQGQSVKMKMLLPELKAEMTAPQISVVSDPPGATITLDGVEVGKAPWSAPSTAGDHVVALSAPGYKPREEKFNLPNDREFELRINWILEPVRRSVTVASAAAREPMVAAPEAALPAGYQMTAGGQVAMLPPPPPPPPPKKELIYGGPSVVSYVGLGGAVVLAAGGGILLGVAERKRIYEWDSCVGCVPTVRDQKGQEYWTLALIGNLMFAGAGAMSAFAMFAAVFFPETFAQVKVKKEEDRKPEEKKEIPAGDESVSAPSAPGPSVAFAPGPVGSGAGVVVGGTF
jgi:hypothetical protein